jgi:hypothetical protein
VYQKKTIRFRVRIPISMQPNVKITQNNSLYSSICQTVIVELVVATYKLKLFASFVTNPSDWLVVIVDSLRIKKYT